MTAIHRKPDFGSIKVGETLPPLRWTAGIKDVEAFGEVLYSKTSSRATNPHLNAEYASQHIYGGLTVDGNQTVDFLCRMVASWLPRNASLSHDSVLDIKFPNPCRVGDTVEFRGTVTETSSDDQHHTVHVDVIAENQSNKVIAVGRISASLSR